MLYNNVPFIFLLRLIGFDPDNTAWGLFNGRTVTANIQCYSPSAVNFCVSFEVTSLDRGNVITSASVDYCT